MVSHGNFVTLRTYFCTLRLPQKFLVSYLHITVIFVSLYYFLGRPEAPGNLRIVPSIPISLVWNRPANIPEGVVIIYNVIINHDIVGGIFNTLDETEASIILGDAIENAVECMPIMFLVAASVVGTADSVAAVTNESVPFLCKCIILHE